MFGYVPKELCDFVLSAIDKGDILNVEFSWIKYCINYSKYHSSSISMCTATSVRSTSIPSSSAFSSVHCTVYFRGYLGLISPSVLLVEVLA